MAHIRPEYASGDLHQPIRQSNEDVPFETSVTVETSPEIGRQLGDAKSNLAEAARLDTGVSAGGGRAEPNTPSNPELLVLPAGGLGGLGGFEIKSDSPLAITPTTPVVGGESLGAWASRAGHAMGGRPTATAGAPEPHGLKPGRNALLGSSLPIMYREDADAWFKTLSRAPEAQRPNVNADVYGSIVDNGFQEVRNHPLSTFSIDVDTAQLFQCTPVSQRQNALPPKDAVRIEEMVNYFRITMLRRRTKNPSPCTSKWRAARGMRPPAGADWDRRPLAHRPAGRPATSCSCSTFPARWIARTSCRW